MPPVALSGFATRVAIRRGSPIGHSVLAKPGRRCLSLREGKSDEEIDFCNSCYTL
jgi:hypothetical protein